MPPGVYGRYDPAMCERVRIMCINGAAIVDVARDLGISPSTVYYWRNQYPEFAQAFRSGGESAVDFAEIRLWEKAVGYRYQEEVVTKEIDPETGMLTEKVSFHNKELPPDNSALFFYLKNRRPHKWKDRHEVSVNHNIRTLTSNEINSLILENAEYEVIKDPLAITND